MSVMRWDKVAVIKAVEIRLVATTASVKLATLSTLMERHAMVSIYPYDIFL